MILSPTVVFFCILYQLVNLVLETCLIFSKILKLSKTFLSWVFSCSLITQTTSVMILLFQIIFRNSFQEGVFLEYFYKANCGANIRFLTHLFFRKMFKLLACKGIMTFESRVVMWRIDFKSIGMAQGFYFLLDVWREKHLLGDAM